MQPDILFLNNGQPMMICHKEGSKPVPTWVFFVRVPKRTSNESVMGSLRHVKVFGFRTVPREFVVSELNEFHNSVTFSDHYWLPGMSRKYVFITDFSEALLFKLMFDGMKNHDATF